MTDNWRGICESEIIYGQIVGKANNYQNVPVKGERRIIKNAKIRQYEKAFQSQCLKYKNKGISRPFVLHADIYYQSKRYDIDNSVKTLLDCLQYAKAIKDDNLCMRLDIRKHIDGHNPRVEYGLEETEPTLFG